jgi:hypothetical protein
MGGITWPTSLRCGGARVGSDRRVLRVIAIRVTQPQILERDALAKQLAGDGAKLLGVIAKIGDEPLFLLLPA